MHTFLEGGLCICIYTFVGCNLYLYPASVNADWEEHKITWLHLCCRKSLTMNSDKGGAGRAGDFCPKRCGGTVVDDNLCWGTPTKRDKKWVWSNSHFKTFQTHTVEKSQAHAKVWKVLGGHSTFENTQRGKVQHIQKCVWSKPLNIWQHTVGKSQTRTKGVKSECGSNQSVTNSFSCCVAKFSPPATAAVEKQ